MPWTSDWLQATEAALWNLLVQRIGALRTVLARAPTLQGSRSHLQHTSQDLQTALAFFARHARDVEPVEELAESLSRWTNARLQVVHQICMQEAGQIERAASRTQARAWKDWALTTAMADGARLAHRWVKQVVPWADASVDANGLAVRQEQADSVAKE